mmetsp:Transcript_51094/g.95706  ORF Transcript_51094/g.95706 Transcript_51094/m.95706 type:complete len:170 (+) Transcript_51094:41-550(+)
MPGRFPPAWAEDTVSAPPSSRPGSGTFHLAEPVLVAPLSRRSAADFLGEVHQEVRPRLQAAGFLEADADRRGQVEDVEHQASRARSKAGRVEERSAWIKGQARGSFGISKRANRIAFGALLFTILGVAVDVVSNVISVFATKRMMTEVEDEAAQVMARRRNELRSASGR